MGTYQNATTSPTITAGYICKHFKEETDKEYYQIIFPGNKIIWAFFENEHYEQNIEDFKENNDSIKEFFKARTCIPKYTIYRDKKKIGTALPRNAHEHDDKPFLYIPKTLKKRGKYSKNRKAIGRNYYIFDVDDDYIINDSARLLFYQ